MLFNPNQTEFANDVHRKVWQYGINIVPPEVSLADVDDKETRDGCTQIYNYTMEILQNMWNKPDQYKDEEGWPDLYTVGGFRWLMGVNKTVSKKCKESFALFKLRLPSLGFKYNEEKNEWTNDRYPLFCEYMARFLALYKKRKQNMGDYPKRCDFRLFAKRVKLSIDDLLRPLPDTKRAWILALREYVMANGAKEQRDEWGHFRYYYRGVQAFNLYNSSHFSVPYWLKDNPGFEGFLAIAENQPDADILVEYIQSNLKLCDGCAANVASRAKEKEKKKCGYYWVDVRSARLLSCISSCVSTGYNSMSQGDFNDEDATMPKRLFDIRVQQIETYLGDGSHE